MADNAGLNVDIGITLGKLLKQLNRAEARTVKTAKKMETAFSRSTKRSAQSFWRIDRAVARSSVSVGRFGGILAGALSVRQIQGYADAWTVAQNKIAAAGQVAGLAGRELSEINDIADRTRSGIAETADLYAKLLRATKGVAKSELEVARATELVNKAFKAGGAAASEQAAGILQLAQGLSSGVLQGDELRSIRENAPLVAQAIADEFGVTIGKLKELGSQGELTSERVFRAILNGQPKIEAAFAKTNATIGEGFTRLRNAITEYIGGADRSAEATQKIGVALEYLADHLEEAAAAAGLLAARFGGAALGAMLLSLASKANIASVALVGLSGGARIAAASVIGFNGAIALLGGPIGAILVGLGALALALDRMPTAQENLEASIDNVTIAMGDEIAQINQLLALQPGANRMTLSAAQAKLQEAEAIYAKLKIQREEIQTTITASEAYKGVLQSINDYREALNTIALPGTDLEKVPARLRDAYAESEAGLVLALAHQQELLNAAGSTTRELDAAAEKIKEWRAGIEAAKGNLVTLNGEIIEGVDLSERLGSAAGGVNFDSAAASASALADQLQRAVSAAASLASQGAANVTRSRINFEYRDDPVGRAGALAGAAFDSRVGDQSGADKILRDVFAGQRESAIAAAIEAAQFDQKTSDAGKSSSGGGGVASGGTARQVENLERQIALIGKSTSEVASLNAKYQLLNEAKDRGLDLDRVSADTGQTLRQEIEQQADSIGRLTEKYEQAKDQAQFFDQAQQQLKGGLIDAIVEGESLNGVLQDLAKSLAKAALEAALFNSGPFAGTGGGGGLLGSLFSGVFGGFRASGGPVSSGRQYVVGENGPEMFVPSSSGVIVPNGKFAGSNKVDINLVVESSADLLVVAADAGRQASIAVTQVNNRALAEFQRRS